MRKVLGLAAVAVLVTIGAAACQPVEPAMTITAKADAYPLAATYSHVTGTVSPASATAKVYLQRTVGGNWVDWQSCPAVGCLGAAPKVPQANVNPSTGAYSITYPVQWCGVVLHLRVRSVGSSAYSPAFYTKATPGESC